MLLFLTVFFYNVSNKFWHALFLLIIYNLPIASQIMYVIIIKYIYKIIIYTCTCAALVFLFKIFFIAFLQSYNSYVLFAECVNEAIMRGMIF